MVAKGRIAIASLLVSVAVIAYLALNQHDLSISDAQRVGSSLAMEAESSNSSSLMFLGLTPNEDLLLGKEVILNAGALQRGDTLWLPVGREGQLQEFSNYSASAGMYSTSYSGIINVKGVNQPLTVTISDDAVYATIPTHDGVLEGSGDLSGMRFRSRRVTEDEIRESDMSEEGIVEEPDREFRCLNC